MYCQAGTEFEGPQNCLATRRRTMQKKPGDTTPFELSFQTSEKQQRKRDPFMTQPAS